MVGDVLIVGGGIGGMTAALALKQRGVAVTLIDSDPNWRVYGAGISITGMSMRAFHDLGVLDEIRERGFVCAGGLRRKGVAGEDFTLGKGPPPLPDDPPPIMLSGGILRPVLHDILSRRVRGAGVEVRLGLTVAAIDQDDDGVSVTFSDGSSARHALVVGADGIFSSIRAMIFPDAAKPQFTGQGCWRVVADRPASVDRPEIYFGGDVKLGMSPISPDKMYCFILEHVPGNPWFAPETLLPRVAELMAPFGGNVPAVRAALGPASEVNYRPLEWLLLPDPWYVGRVVLIGDAAHATTPHMASGAGLAVEDGLVLAEELTRTDDVAAALRAFMARRYERAKLVVESSVRMGAMEIADKNSLEGNLTLMETNQKLAAPY